MSRYNKRIMNVQIADNDYLPFPWNWIVGLPLSLIALTWTALLLLAIVVAMLAPIALIIWIIIKLV